MTAARRRTADDARSGSLWPHVEERVARPDRAAPLDHRLRQLPPARRAAHRPAQRAGAGRAESEGSEVGRSLDSQAPAPRRLMAQSGQSDGRATARRARPPRLGLQGAAGDHRGRPQARPAPVRRRHQQPRARHRHGRRRPRHPGRVAALGGQRPAAGRSRRPPGRRDLARRAVPQAPRRPGALRGRRRADAQRRHRGTPRADQPARRPRPADGRRDRARHLDVDELVRRRATHRVVRRRSPAARTTRRSTCSPGATRATSSPSCGRGSSGTASPASSPAGPGAQRLAVTSGGTIPDRGLFGVFLVGERASRVGELDEEMVYESRVGDVFTLGTTSWRIEDITHDRVLVAPAPGQPGRLPFWNGDTLGRPAELGAAIGAFTREISAMPREQAIRRATDAGLDEWAADNLVSLVEEQREATGAVPHDQQIVVERFRDELGDWRLVVHSPYGTPVHAPWALAINARLRERYGVDAQAMATDDGIVLRIPETDQDPPGAELIAFEPDELEQIVTTEVGGSALFASRFRECAARALLLPRRDPGRRAPLWQQRQRSAQLLEVAARYPSFPIVLETVREVLQDVYDLPSLTALHRRIAERTLRLVDVADPAPVAVRPVAAVRVRRGVHVRGRLAARRAARRGPDPRPGAARRAARPGRAARAARPRGARRGRGRAAAARRGPPGHATARASPTCCACSARCRPTRSASPVPLRPTRWTTGSRCWSRLAASCRCGSPGTTASPSSRTSPGCATRSARRCRPACPTRSPSRSTTRSATSSAATPAPTGRSPPATWPQRLGLGVAVCHQTLARLSASRAGARGRVPALGQRRRVVRRRGAADAAPPLAGAAAARGRAGRADGARPVPAVLAAHRRPPAWPRRRGHRRRAARRVRRTRERPGDPRPAHAGGRLRAGPARRAHRHRRGALGRPRRTARLRRLGLSAPGRHRSPDPARPRRARGRPRPRGRAGRPRAAAARSSSASWPPPSASSDDRALSAALWDLVWAGHVGNDTLAPLRALARRPRHAPGQRRSAPRVAVCPAAAVDAGAAHGSARRAPAAGSCCPTARPTRPGARTPSPRGCSSATASSPAAPSSASAPPAGSPRPTRCSPRSRRPAAAAAATSSRASAPPSSAPPAPSTGSAPISARRPPRASRSPTPSRWPRPTRPTRTAPRCRGPTTRAATAPAARPERSSCSSTASSSSTSSAAARRC